MRRSDCWSASAECRERTYDTCPCTRCTQTTTRSVSLISVNQRESAVSCVLPLLLPIIYYCFSSQGVEFMNLSKLFKRKSHSKPARAPAYTNAQRLRPLSSRRPKRPTPRLQSPNRRLVPGESAPSSTMWKCWIRSSCSCVGISSATIISSRFLLYGSSIPGASATSQRRLTSTSSQPSLNQASLAVWNCSICFAARPGSPAAQVPKQ